MLITSLAAVAFNPSGSKLATASERGTFLAIFLIIIIIININHDHYQVQSSAFSTSLTAQGSSSFGEGLRGDE